MGGLLGVLFVGFMLGVAAAVVVWATAMTEQRLDAVPGRSVPPRATGGKWWIEAENAEDSEAPVIADYLRTVNVPTRGEPDPYERVGYLSSKSLGGVQVNNVLPLLGRPTYPGSAQWNYFTQTEAGVRIPLRMDGVDCTEGVPGCREIDDGDSVDVPELAGEYTARVYRSNAPRYLPSI